MTYTLAGGAADTGAINQRTTRIAERRLKKPLPPPRGGEGRPRMINGTWFGIPSATQSIVNCARPSPLRGGEGEGFSLARKTLTSVAPPRIIVNRPQPNSARSPTHGRR